MLQTLVALQQQLVSTFKTPTLWQTSIKTNKVNLQPQKGTFINKDTHRWGVGLSFLKQAHKSKALVCDRKVNESETSTFFVKAFVNAPF